MKTHNIGAAFFFGLVFSAYSIHVPAVESTSRISVPVTAGDTDNTSTNPSISADGRFVAFESRASNLVANDNNNRSDVFVYDVANDTIELVSADGSGAPGNNDSNAAWISSDGRFVVFQSLASNLVANDTNGAFDIFIADRVNGTMQRVSVDSAGQEAIGHSLSPRVSGNGRYVVFYSTAGNLVSGDTNRQADVFLHDRTSAVTQLISMGNGGVQGNRASLFPDVSDDGRFVTFLSSATNLVPNDTNNAQDVFLFDRTQNLMQRVNLGTNGAQANDWSGAAAISDNGRYIAFDSVATNLVSGDTNNTDDVFVFDRNSGVLERVSVAADGTQADGYSNQPALSANGDFVTFFSFATNIVSGDSNGVEDIVMHETATGNKTIVSLATGNTAANDSSFLSSVSSNGQLIAFSSFATNLVTGDSNTFEDVYLRDLGSANQPPIANAGDDQSMFLGERLFLDGTRSFDPEGAPITQYSWQIISAPLDSMAELHYANTATPLFFPDMAGNYVIALTVFDGEVFSDADEVIVHVTQNLPPLAVIHTDVTTGFAPLTIQFDASQSSDPENSTLTFNWDFGDDSGSSQVSPSHTYTSPGTYIAALTVRDNFNNSDTAMVEITVQGVNQKPVVEIIALSPTSGPSPLTVNLAARVVEPDGDTVSIEWDMGDGTLLSGAEVTHIYVQSGEFVVTLTVSDGEFIVTDDLTVTVDAAFILDVTSAKVRHIKHPHTFQNIDLKMKLEGNLVVNANSPIQINVDEREIFQAFLGDFREIRPNIYWYRMRHTYVRLDLNRGKLKILRNKVDLGDAVDDERLNVSVTIGAHTATDNVELKEHKHWHHAGHHDGNHKKCNTTHVVK